MRTRIAAGLAFSVLGAVAWIVNPSQASGGFANTLEVRQLEVGYAVGKPGLKARLTLATGQAVEYRAEDPLEAQSFLQLAELFVGSRAKLFAQVEGNDVIGVHVAGPAREGR